METDRLWAARSDIGPQYSEQEGAAILGDGWRGRQYRKGTWLTPEGSKSRQPG
jgi:hypothetical protein